MEKQAAMALLEETFGNGFEDKRFSLFVKELFNKFDLAPKKWPVWNEYSDYIDSLSILGSYKEGKSIIDVLVVKLKRSSSVERARTMQRNLIAKYLSVVEKDAALVAFYYEGEMDWRFSFVKMEYRLKEADGGKVTVEKNLTPAKRHSFLVGKNEPNYTCKRQFLDLIIEEERLPSIASIESAFSIENVTREFFNEYKNLYLDLRDSVDGVLEENSNVRKEFEDKGITSVDFSKKLLGQIVFIYFLQKKGWLGVQKKGDNGFHEWGTGPRNFLRKLFSKDIISYENFFNDILEPLFYEALATSQRDDDYYSRFNCKIPFLNGGLFEPIGDYNWVNTDITIDNSIFQRILDTFDRYNFTIKEDEPLDKEVAIDPEMLGKVFENLLEVNDRKSTGSFYTPREIVYYMCQQSLVNYLEANTSIERQDLMKFLQFGEFSNAEDERLLIEINTINDELIHAPARVTELKKKLQKCIDSLSLPKSIIQNRERIDHLLKVVKVVDPAVGSGAFPVGMMTEIVRARSVLTPFLNESDQKGRTDYNLKRETIENCLYGVDIDSSAVDIAKLRFWLSLIVDEVDMRNIKPLPNLDHKIMVGNSLLQEFEGMKLFDEQLLGQPSKMNPELEEIDGKIKQLYLEYGDIYRGVKKSTNGRMEEIQKELKRFERRRKEIIDSAKIKEESRQATLEDSVQQRIKQSQIKLNELKRLQRLFFNEQDRKAKKEHAERINKIEWELIEETLKEEGNEKALSELAQYKRSRSKPFFLWKLYFAEVFQRDNSGFDIVIANPPYVRIQNLDEETKGYLKRKFPTATGNFDIYVVFDELGISLLNERGHQTYIQSNKFLTADYGIGLRRFLSSGHHLKQLVDFRDQQTFSSATTYTCLLFCSKMPNDRITYVTFAGDDPSSEFLSFSLGNASQNVIYQEEDANILDEDNWVFHSGKVGLLLDTVNRGSVKLEVVVDNIFQGVVTSADPVFIVKQVGNGKFYSRHLDTTVELEKSFLKPLLKGADIRRYAIDQSDLWLIFPYDTAGDSPELISKKIFETKYPKTWAYLRKCEKTLRQREKGKMDHDRWYAYVYPKNLVLFGRRKILAQVLAKKASFVVDDVGYHFVGGGNAGGYGIILKQETGLDPRYLNALLNSSLLDFCLKQHSTRFQNGYFSYAKRYIERLPIKKIGKESQEPFIKIVSQILNLTKDGKYEEDEKRFAEVQALERRIDQLVYGVYGLTEEEIMLVENGLKR